jgi:hypothetical protein
MSISSLPFPPQYQVDQNLVPFMLLWIVAFAKSGQSRWDLVPIDDIKTYGQVMPPVFFQY